MAEVKIPDSLKADVPKTLWGKILTATPIVMTVVATMLAGLSTSEMTRAQYNRATAAQQQSKTGDEWEFFQARRLRSALQSSTADVVQNTAEVRPLDAAAQAVFAPLAAPPKMQLDAALQAALDAAAGNKSEKDVAALVARVDDAALEKAVIASKERADAFDASLRPAIKAIDDLEKQSEGKPNHRDIVAGRLRYAAQRYDMEARLNQETANLMELQVRKSNQAAERHERRSQRFFFGMLAAQAAVIIATFALAAEKRNLLWGVAAAAGAAAVGFAAYVYLFI